MKEAYGIRASRDAGNDPVTVLDHIIFVYQFFHFLRQHSLLRSKQGKSHDNSSHCVTARFFLSE